MIDVDQCQRQRPLVACGAAPFTQQGLIEMATVGQPGQAVQRGQAGQFLIGGIELAGEHHQRVAHLQDALHRAHLGRKHHFADRLEQVVVTASGDALHQIGVGGASGQEDDGCPFAGLFDGADAARHFVAVHARQHHVEQHDVRIVFPEQRDAALAVCGRDRLYAHALQMLADDRKPRLRVLDDQRFHVNTRFFARHHNAARAKGKRQCSAGLRMRNASAETDGWKRGRCTILHSVRPPPGTSPV